MIVGIIIFLGGLLSIFSPVPIIKSLTFFLYIPIALTFMAFPFNPPVVPILLVWFIIYSAIFAFIGWLYGKIRNRKQSTVI